MKCKIVLGALCLTITVAPANAQSGQLGRALDKVVEVSQDLTFTEAEEAQLGSDISARLRERYGVVQDKAVHKYVTLVGTVVASRSSRPGLKWIFIVLDTDGVNAFAAPGGLIHITRGALALIQNEAELADVLGHEISHVTAKHTINAIQKSKAVNLGAQATRKDVLSQAADRGYGILLENNFDRHDEMDADETGVTLADASGYSPTGLGAFLNRLANRNKDLKDRSGLFASHPETQARVDALSKVITGTGLKSTATMQTRYAAASLSGMPAGESPAPPPKAPESKGGTLGLSGLAGLGREKSSSQTVSSAGSRGVNPDRDAKGGPVATLVAVTVTPAEVAVFKQGIAG